MSALLGPLGIYVGTFVVCFVSGLVPLVNAEAFLLVLAASATRAELVPVAVLAALGQMGAKTIMYFAGRGALRLRRLSRYQARMDALREKLARKRLGINLTLLVSSSVGLPPFLLMSVVAGSLRVPFARFFAIGLCGRFTRFAVTVFVPGLVLWIWAWL